MMLFAYKQQKHNPNKLASVNPEMPWMKEVIDESQKTTYEADNWVVLESDDFSGYLMSIGVDPTKQFI